MFVLVFVAFARMLYWPPAPRSRWFEVLCWAFASALILSATVFALMFWSSLTWRHEAWSVVMVVFIAVWGYSLLYPHGKLWRAFHPSEWGAPHENQQR